jgi:DNA-binding NarL/FixJ family response regulator
MVALLVADGAGRPPHEGLSDRELQVLRMLAAGTSVKEIGGKLALSEKTISTYRHRILGKMQMRSNAELMRYALRVGLVD